MLELRKVLIQDSIHLMKAVPKHFLWDHPIFASKEYKTYCDSVTLAMATGVSPTDLVLKTAMPPFVDHTNVQHKKLTQHIDTTQALVRDVMGICAKLLTHCKEQSRSMQQVSSIIIADLL